MTQTKYMEAIKVNVNVTRRNSTTKVVGGQKPLCSTKSDGTVWTYGYNGNGQLGLEIQQTEQNQQK